MRGRERKRVKETERASERERESERASERELLLAHARLVP